MLINLSVSTCNSLLELDKLFKYTETKFTKTGSTFDYNIK